MDGNGVSLFGYDSPGILRVVLMDLEEACRQTDRPGCLVIKPHPLEHDGPLRQVVEQCPTEHVKVSVRDAENASYWIVVSDAVLGMMSIALLEAAVAGKPAVSIEIGLKEGGAADPCCGNDLGYTLPVFSRSMLRDTFGRLCRGEWATIAPVPSHPMRVEGAAARVADVLLSAGAQKEEFCQ